MNEHQDRPRLGPVVVRVLLAVALGLVIGALGTVVHRYGDESSYLGMVLGLTLTAAAAVMCRAWSGYGALLAFAGGWVVMVQLMSLRGSGGDVLVPAGTLGLVWTYAGVAVLGATAFLPSTWFREVPVREPDTDTSGNEGPGGPVTSTEPPLGVG
ncbi:hypothetical protein GCM10028784_13970 [Myceligenerans cantabricum]